MSDRSRVAEGETGNPREVALETRDRETLHFDADDRGILRRHGTIGRGTRQFRVLSDLCGITILRGLVRGVSLAFRSSCGLDCIGDVLGNRGAQP
jgi:hypothetical protein